MFGNTTLGWFLPIHKHVRPPLLDNTLLRNPNFVVVRIYLFFMVLMSLVFFMVAYIYIYINVLKGCPMPNLTISPSLTGGRLPLNLEKSRPIGGRLFFFFNVPSGNLT